MEQDYISICMTLKNRANLLDACLHHLQYQNYDLKNKVEICISDGYSTDDIVGVINKYKHLFFQIKYCLVDKNMLPYNEIDVRAEVNATIQYLASYEKIVLLHPEILFIDNNSLQIINKDLSDNPNSYLYHGGCLMRPAYVYPRCSQIKNYQSPDEECAAIHPTNGWCVCFNQRAFIKLKGFTNDHNHMQGLWEKVYPGCVKKMPYNVIHLWHDPRTLSAEQISPSIKDPYWNCKKIIKDINIFK